MRRPISLKSGHTSVKKNNIVAGNFLRLHTIPCILVLILFIIEIIICQKQINDYINNAEDYFKRMRDVMIEGVNSLETSIDAVKSKRATSIIQFIAFTLICILLTASLDWIKHVEITENASLSNTVEYILLLGFNVFTPLFFHRKNEQLQLVTIIIIVAIVLLLYYIKYIHKRVSFKEMLLYYTAISPIISLLLNNLLSSGIKASSTAIEDCNNVTRDTKDRMVRICAWHNFDYSAIRVRKDPSFTAMAVWNFICRFIIFPTGCLDKLEGEELVAIFCHELGHIVHRDHLKYILLQIGTWIFVLATMVVLYRRNKDSKDMALVIMAIQFVVIFELKIFNYLFMIRSHRCEYSADLFGLTTENFNHSVTMLKKMEMAGEYALFDYSSSLNILDTHPPTLKRINAILRHFS